MPGPKKKFSFGNNRSNTNAKEKVSGDKKKIKFKTTETSLLGTPIKTTAKMITKGGEVVRGKIKTIEKDKGGLFGTKTYKRATTVGADTKIKTKFYGKEAPNKNREKSKVRTPDSSVKRKFSNKFSHIL